MGIALSGWRTPEAVRPGLSYSAVFHFCLYIFIIFMQKYGCVPMFNYLNTFTNKTSNTLDNVQRFRYPQQSIAS
jgi:hypothetical protein